MTQPTAIGPYQLKEEIGRGGAAVVYRAEDTKVGRTVAIKILFEHAGDVVRERFVREAHAAAKLSHPGFVTIHDVGEHDGRPFMVMELVDGQPLNTKLPHRELAGLLRKIALALEHAHQNGIIHRDLKPGNILVDSKGEPRIVDFGLARLTDTEVSLTQTGSALGTPLYMAPEQIGSKSREVTPRTDIWALGTMLYECLYGRPPFKGEDVTEVYENILSLEPEAPEGPRSLVLICMKAIEKDPLRRYESARAFAEDLERFLAGEPVEAQPPSTMYIVQKQISKHMLPVAVIGAVLLALLTVFLIRSSMAASAFDAHSENARQAFKEKRWADALSSIAQALDLREDAQLSQLATDCRAKLKEEERLAGEARVYRKLLDQIRPVDGLIKETRPFFYVASVDMRQKLRVVEQALAKLEVLTKNGKYAGYAELWTTLGIGWYVAGEERKSEAALLEAEKIAPDDGWVTFYLARIYMERSIYSLLSWTEGNRAHHERRNEESQRWIDEAEDRLKREVTGWSGAREIDRHVASAYLALAENRINDVLDLCTEGRTKFGNVPGTEEYDNLEGYAIGPSDRRLQVEAYSSALKRRPHYAWAYFMRAIAQEDLGNREKALEDYDHALQLNPTLLPAYVNRGSIKHQKKELDSAIVDFTQAIEIDPTYAIAWAGRGLSYADKNDFDQAYRDYSEAIRLDSDLAPAYNNRGNILSKQGKNDAAIADFKQALALDPDYAAPYVNLAQIYLNRKQWQDALDMLNQALSRNAGDADLYAERGHLHYMKRDYKKALKDYDEAIRRAPKDPGLYSNRSVVHLAMSNWDAVIADCDKALDIDSEFFMAWGNRANGKLMKGDYEGAIDDFTQSLSIRESPEAYTSRGSAYEQIEDRDSALEDYRKALKIAPRNWGWTNEVKRRIKRLEEDD